MKWFYNLKIAAKLVIGFLMVAIIAGVIGTIGVINIYRTDKKYTELYEQYGVALGEIGQADIYYQRIRVNTRDLMLAKNSVERDEYISRIKAYDKKMQEYLKSFEESIKTDDMRKEFEVLNNELLNYNTLREEFITLILQNRQEEALEIMRGDAALAANAFEDSIGSLIESKEVIGRQESDGLSKGTTKTIVAMVIIVGFSMIIAILLGIFLSRMISKPIIKMVEAADKLAQGDVNVNVESSAKDEVGILSKSFGQMIENIREQANAIEKIASGDLTIEVKVKSSKDLLGKNISKLVKTQNEVIANIMSSADQVAAGARQVSSSSQMLSQSSTEQASAIEETTATIEEITSQTKQNTQNANQASQIASVAQGDASIGNQKMVEMLKSMEDINESSTKVSKIIKVIDEIAFQTNILALNAAVEAARAGQHGKGFAVVAEEVRNLAARSASAAKETTDMIEGSINKVGVGMKIADETSAALEKITEGASRVAELLGGIATASNEQDIAINQISHAITQISQAVQSNSATSEESAAASEELSSQSDLLKDLVNKFKLKKVSGFKLKADSLNYDSTKIRDDIENNENEYYKKSMSEYMQEAAPTIDEMDFGKY